MRGKRGERRKKREERRGKKGGEKSGEKGGEKRERVPQFSTVLLSQCQQPRAGIDRLPAPSTVEVFGRARPHAVTALRTVMTANCTVVQLQSRSQHFDCPFIRHGDADVHVPQLGVPPHGGTSLAAHAREGPFGGDSLSVGMLHGVGLENPENHSHLVFRDQWQCGTTTASRGTRLQWAPHATPDWDMVQSVIANGPSRQHTANTTVSRKWCSELEDEWYCQP